ARLVTRGHGEQRRDGAKLEGAGRRRVHAREAVTRSCGAPDRAGRGTGLDRSRRPQGQSGVDWMTSNSAPRGDAAWGMSGRHKCPTPIMSEGAVYANENSTADRYVQGLPPGGLRHVDGFEEAPVAVGGAG